MKRSPGISAVPAPEVVLRAAGLRCTPVRMSVIQLLLEATRPMGAQQIVDHLPGHTDSVTVYRTLNTLTSKRLLHRVRGDEGAWLYAMETPVTAAAPQSQRVGHSHAHFVCDDCGIVECLKDTPVPPGMTAGLQVGRGYDVTYSELLLHGTCPKCHK